MVFLMAIFLLGLIIAVIVLSDKVNRMAKWFTQIERDLRRLQEGFQHDAPRPEGTAAARPAPSVAKAPEHRAPATTESSQQAPIIGAGLPSRRQLTPRPPP